MELKKSKKEMNQRVSIVSSMRVALGFLMAPTLGALVFYLMLNVPLLFGYELPGMLLSISPEFIFGGTIIAGSLFYAPTVMLGLGVMMLIRRYFSWNLANCIFGGVLSAFAVSSLFLTVLVGIGQTLTVAGAGFSMVMTLIVVPSVLSGMSFWLIAVHNNKGLEQPASRDSNHQVQLAPAGECIGGGHSFEMPVDYYYCPDDEGIKTEETL